MLVTLRRTSARKLTLDVPIRTRQRVQAVGTPDARETGPLTLLTVRRRTEDDERTQHDRRDGYARPGTRLPRCAGDETHKLPDTVGLQLARNLTGFLEGCNRGSNKCIVVHINR